MTLVLISAVLAVGGSGRLLGFTTLLVLPALGAEWVDHYQPGLDEEIDVCALSLVKSRTLHSHSLRFACPATARLDVGWVAPSRNDPALA